MTEFVGRQLGNYRVIRLLGQGGFASVYLGEHIYLKTQAAIKVLQAQLSNEDMATFQQEARMISGLVHPNIVRVLEFGIEAGTPFLVMDYAPNGTLRQRHPRGSRLSPATIALYVRQVAAALQYAHDRKLIHRDVKPENMLVGPNGEILLSDFGIALLAQSSRYQSTQDVVGTIAYMAPEQFQGRPVPASDQYALGVVVFEWLAGDRPFHGSFGEIVSQHVMAEPALREKVPGISLAIAEVVRTALAKEPQQRFLRIQAFANAFDQATQASQPRSVSPMPPFQSPVAGPGTPAGQPPRGQPMTPDPHPNSFPASPSSPAYGVPRQASFNQSGQLTPPPTPANQPGYAPQQAPSPFGAGVGPGFAPDAGSAGMQQSQSPLVVPPPQLTLPPQVAASYSDQAGPTYIMNQPGQGQPASSGSNFPPVGAAGQQAAKKAAISRRTFLVGALGVGVVVGGSAITWLALAHESSSSTPGTTATTSANSNTTATSQTGGQTPTAGTTDTAVQTSTPEATTTSAISALVSFTGHSRYIGMLAWSPDGTKVATASGDGTVQVWNAASGTMLYTYTGHQSQNQNTTANAVAWSSDGSTIYSAGTDVQVWNAADGTKLFTYAGHSNNTIYCLALSPDGKRVATGSDDGTVQIWDAHSGTHYTTHNANGRVLSLAWSADGSRMASTTYDKVEVWNASSGNTINTYNGHSGNTVNAVAWSHNGKHMASGSDDKTVQVWDAFSLSPSYTYPGDAQAVYAIAWSPDDRRIASGGADQTVQIWNSTDGTSRFVYHGHTSRVNTLAWSPDGSKIASGSGDPNTSDGSDDHTAQVWKPA